MSCLPYGNYYFTCQEDIDHFQSDYPGCTELNGRVEISGENIKNLTGLDGVISIEGTLEIDYNDSLTSLSGLQGLASIGAAVRIHHNNNLTSLSGIDNLSSIGSLTIWDNDNLSDLTGLASLTSSRFLSINNNDILTSLSGLENMDAGIIEWLSIIGNSMLSECAIQSICDYLALPNAEVTIYGNADGCNSRQEVEEACETVGVEEILPGKETFSVYPNPFTRQTTLEFTLQQGGPVHLAIYNQLGEQVAVPVDEFKPAGVHKVSWNAAGLPAGIYYIRLQAGTQIYSGKMILMK
jgi:hypothetical protein